jgi:hypothetical protein
VGRDRDPAGLGGDLVEQAGRDSEHGGEHVMKDGGERLPASDVVLGFGRVGVEHDQHHQLLGRRRVLEVVEVSVGCEDYVALAGFEAVLGAVGADDGPPDSTGEDDVRWIVGTAIGTGVGQ